MYSFTSGLYRYFSVVVTFFRFGLSSHTSNGSKISSPIVSPKVIVIKYLLSGKNRPFTTQHAFSSVLPRIIAGGDYYFFSHRKGAII